MKPISNWPDVTENTELWDNDLTDKLGDKGSTLFHHGPLLESSCTVRAICRKEADVDEKTFPMMAVLEVVETSVPGTIESFHARYPGEGLESTLEVMQCAYDFAHKVQAQASSKGESGTWRERAIAALEDL